MTWDWLVQRAGKYCSIRRMEYPEFQTGIFGRMESAHYHVFAHAQAFDFRTGGQEIKDAGIDIELSQIRLHRPQSTLALP